MRSKEEAIGKPMSDDRWRKEGKRHPIRRTVTRAGSGWVTVFDQRGPGGLGSNIAIRTESFRRWAETATYLGGRDE